MTGFAPVRHGLYPFYPQSAWIRQLPPHRLEESHPGCYIEIRIILKTAEAQRHREMGFAGMGGFIAQLTNQQVTGKLTVTEPVNDVSRTFFVFKPCASVVNCFFQVQLLDSCLRRF